MTKGKIINLAVTAILAVSVAATALVMKSKIDGLSHENAVERFSSGDAYSQITLFIPESAEFTIDKVMYFRYNLETKLTEQSLTPNSGARLYADAYSATKNDSLQSESLRTSNVKTLYFGGDYKLFHTEFATLPDICRDVNHDRIILSKTAAWQLYGGYSLYDFTVKSSGDETLYISGVANDCTDSDSVEYYGDRNAVFADITNMTSLPITCYEIVLPNPVKNFAVDTVKECIGLDEGSYLLVENSERFTLSNLIDTAKKLSASDEQLPTGVNITPAEMTARRAEKELAILLVVATILAIYPAVWVIIWAWKLFKLIKGFFGKHVSSKIKDKFSYS